MFIYFNDFLYNDVQHFHVFMPYRVYIVPGYFIQRIDSNRIDFTERNNVKSTTVKREIDK